MIRQTFLDRVRLTNHIIGKYQESHMIFPGSYLSLTEVEEESGKRISIISGARLSNFHVCSVFEVLQFQSKKLVSNNRQIEPNSVMKLTIVLNCAPME